MTESQSHAPKNRQFDRLHFESNLQLFSSTTAWDCQMIDISLKGVLFSKPLNWKGHENEIYRLVISLTNSPSISMNIQIMNIDTNTIGAKWNKIDVASFTQLKRLLELNNTTKHKIQKEISAL